MTCIISGGLSTTRDAYWDHQEARLEEAFSEDFFTNQRLAASALGIYESISEEVNRRVLVAAHSMMDERLKVAKDWTPLDDEAMRTTE